MSEPQHYPRGPSAAHQWLICTESPEAQAPFPDVTTDPADEGTAAHWLLEQCLTAGQDCQEWLDAGWASSHGYVVPAGKLTGCLKDWPVTGEMIEAVQLAIDTVKPDIQKRGTKAFFETRVRVDGYLPLNEAVGGTADIILYMPRSKTLKVLDFKYGRGHLVEVAPFAGDVHVLQEDGSYETVSAEVYTGLKYNPQLALYALGALAELEKLLGEKREVKWIELTVIQPRAHHKKGPVRKLKLAPLQLMKLESRLLKAVNGERKRVAGDHCMFCRAQRDCAERAAAKGAIATADFAAEEPTTNVPAPTAAPAPVLNLADALQQPVKGMSLKTLGAIRPHLKDLRKWIETVEAEVKERMLHDLQVPGVKLVYGRGKRPYTGTPAEQAMAAKVSAETLSVELDELYEPRTLKSPAKLEKELGQKAFKATPLSQLVGYVEGGPIVVDEDADGTPWSKSDAFEAAEPVPAPATKHHLL